MQLDAFLRSAKRYAPYETITVLARASDEAHAESYDELWDLLPGRIIREDRGRESFEWWVRQWLSGPPDVEPERKRVVFHTDDDVFYREATISDEFADLGLECGPLSYRLGANTVRCHPLDRAQPLPDATLGLDCMYWRWREAEHDFGYPLCLNGTVYRSADILPLLNFPFRNPTELEAGLDYRKELFRPEWMTAPLHSCCVSLPHNRVSSSSGCPAGANPEWQPDALLERYLDGWRIDLDAMDFANITSAHQEVPLAFTR
jgi:hypothetical protein